MKKKRTYVKKHYRRKHGKSNKGGMVKEHYRKEGHYNPTRPGGSTLQKTRNRLSGALFEIPENTKEHDNLKELWQKLHAVLSEEDIHGMKTRAYNKKAREVNRLYGYQFGTVRAPKPYKAQHPLWR